jgi:hypothetical protein
VSELSGCGAYYRLWAVGRAFWQVLWSQHFPPHRRPRPPPLLLCHPFWALFCACHRCCWSQALLVPPRRQRPVRLPQARLQRLQRLQVQVQVQVRASPHCHPPAQCPPPLRAPTRSSLHHHSHSQTYPHPHPLRSRQPQPPARLPYRNRHHTKSSTLQTAQSPQTRMNQTCSGLQRSGFGYAQTANNTSEQL